MKIRRKILVVKHSPPPSCQAYLSGAYPVELGSFIIVSPKLRDYPMDSVLILDCLIDEDYERKILSVERIGDCFESPFIDGYWKEFYGLSG